MTNFLISFLIIAIIMLLILVSALIFNQRRFIYFPEAFRTPPAATGLSEIEEITLQTNDGEQIIAWYSPASENKPTILYFHGNGGALRYRTERIMLMQQQGYGILMPSYRGYSGSTGKPTEKNIIADAMIAYKWLIEKGLNGKQIVLYGESLGSGVAVQLAAQKETACIILEAPYTSLPDIAKLTYTYLPTHLLMQDQFNSYKFIKDINTPLFITHGALDLVIPVGFGKKLYHEAVQPKKIEIFPQGNHSDLFMHGAWEKTSDFIKLNCKMDSQKTPSISGEKSNNL